MRRLSSNQAAIGVKEYSGLVWSGLGIHLAKGSPAGNRDPNFGHDQSTYLGICAKAHVWNNRIDLGFRRLDPNESISDVKKRGFNPP